MKPEIMKTRKTTGILTTMLFFLIALVFLPTTPSYALSCMEPVLDEVAISDADLIFEGHTLELIHEDTISETSINKYVTYLFAIDKLWKGEIDNAGIDDNDNKNDNKNDNGNGNDKVEISYNAYWGDIFAHTKEFLIVAHMIDGRYESVLCGNTVPLDQAGKKIKALEDYTNKTDKLKSAFSTEPANKEHPKNQTNDTETKTEEHTDEHPKIHQ